MFSTTLFSQTIPLVEIGQLDDVISEPSGLIFHYNTQNGHFEYWANNDYGNTDSIYSFQIDDLTTPKRILDINVDWVDWEDMTSDDAGNFYIADFGNFNQQDELQIVKISDPNGYGGSPPSVDLIKFDYPVNQYTDAEAIVHHQGFLYIFIKSVNPANNPVLVDGITYCFRIPDTPAPTGGTHMAELWGEFETKLAGDDDTGNYRVTAADISPDGRKLVLMTYSRIWVFSCFDNADFFDGTVSHFDVPYRQYEGVTFINNHEIVISKEGSAANPNYNPKLFYIDLFPWIDGSCIDCEKFHNGNFEESQLGWSKFTFGTATANLNINNGIASMQVTAPGTSTWHLSLRHKSIVLTAGKTYTIRYKAWADNARSINIYAGNKSGSLSYTYKQQNITTTPAYYTHEFTMSDPTDFNAYLSFGVGNNLTHTVYFDDLSLMEADCECPSNRYFIAAMDNSFYKQEVSNSIFSNNLITNSDLIFDAGNCIQLNVGFEVESNSNFDAYIDGCDGQ